VRPGVASGQREGYTAALTGLWNRLARALSELESIASDPDALAYEEDVLERLPALQYALHAAAELALGLEPPPRTQTAHAELAAALGGARDATSEVAEVLDLGGAAAVGPLLPEWRGALFRIRLARLRASTPTPLPVPAETAHELGNGNPFAAAALVITGALVFAAGASVELWPIWALGIALFAGGFLAYAPRP
jgi:hypothetical protein